MLTYKLDELLLNDAHKLALGELNGALASGLETEVEWSLVRGFSCRRCLAVGLARWDVDAANRDAHVAVLVQMHQHLATSDAPSNILREIVDLQLLLVPGCGVGNRVKKQGGYASLIFQNLLYVF